MLLRGKSLELEQVRDAGRSVQQQQQEAEETHGRVVRERDAVIGQLQGALHARTQEAQVHTGSDRTGWINSRTASKMMQLCVK